MYPHRIRLRGPWEYQTPYGTGRLTLPVALADTALGGVQGDVTLLRRFGYPGRIDATERVWLVVERPASPLRVTFNDTELGDCASDAEWDITSRLKARNEVRMATPIGPGEPWGEVTMEVRRTAYLRGVRIWMEGAQIHARGELIGQADGLLELYLVAGRRTAAYTTLGATAAGVSFHLSGPIEEASEQAKVELVQGSVVWYTAEVELPPRREE